MTRIPRKAWVLLTATLLIAGLTACSSDNSTNPPGNNPADTTAPQVTGSDPGSGETGISQDHDITIIFSEAMDPASASGNVTLSSGTVSSTTWSDNRTLVVTHSTWAEGAAVTVTVGTGLADAAGNNLAAAHSFSFYVFSSTLSVLSTNPADAATGVNRDSNVQVLFSMDMNQSSILANTTINDGTADHPFTLQSEGSLYTLVVSDRFPGSTVITVTLGADVASSGGATLGTPLVFSFTTGEDVDVTPPTVVSVFPANGSTVQPDVGYFQITFSEPMNPISVEPSDWNVEFALQMMAIDPTPSWTENGTVMTVPLPTTMPAGLPIHVTFGNFTDLNGVVQPTAWTFTATVAGSADYFPVNDGDQHVFSFHEEQGTLGNPTPLWNNDGMEYIQIDSQPDGSFFYAQYDPNFLTPQGNHEVYKKLSNELQWLGFQETDQGGTNTMTFDTPLRVLPLPLAAGNWTSSASVTIPGEGTFNATISGSVEGQMDLPVESNGSEALFYKDAWMVIRTMNVLLDGSQAFANTDTTYYSATLGPVESSEYEEDTLANEWWTMDMMRQFNVR